MGAASKACTRCRSRRQCAALATRALARDSLRSAAIARAAGCSPTRALLALAAALPRSPERRSASCVSPKFAARNGADILAAIERANEPEVQAKVRANAARRPTDKTLKSLQEEVRRRAGGTRHRARDPRDSARARRARGRQPAAASEATAGARRSSPGSARRSRPRSSAFWRARVLSFRRALGFLLGFLGAFLGRSASPSS